MLNHYPLWKYIMLAIVIAVGLLYALPNLYGEEPAIQISNVRNTIVSEQTLYHIQKILKEEKIVAKSLMLKGNVIVAVLIQLKLRFELIKY